MAARLGHVAERVPPQLVRQLLQLLFVSIFRGVDVVNPERTNDDRRRGSGWVNLIPRRGTPSIPRIPACARRTDVP